LLVNVIFRPSAAEAYVPVGARRRVLAVRKQGESAKANDHNRRGRAERRKLSVPLGETTPPITQHRFLLILSAVRDRGRKVYAF